VSQAVLYVELVPTTKGIKRNVEQELGGAFDATETKAKGFWGRVAGFATVAGAAVAATAAAVAGLAIKGGFSRLLNIEDAQAKLIGLGNSTETVTQIMSNALAAVKGTAFGLDAAATVAASAVAAGVKPGLALERTLKLIADTATITGGSLSDLSSIFNGVAASNKLQMDSINQLQDRGFPILQMLAKYLGVTAEEASKMASDGKIDFETFQNAVESSLGAAGTAALTSGNTTRGAFANMLASLSRVGANLLSGVFPLFREAFVGITDLLGPVEDRAKAVGAAFADKVFPIAEKIRTGFEGAGAAVSGVVGTIGPLLAPLAALGAGALLPLLSALPLIGKYLPVISGPIGLIVGGIAALIAISPELRSALGGAFEGIVSAVGGVLTSLGPVISELVPVIVSLAQTVGGALAIALMQLLPFAVQVIGVFGELLAGALPLLIPLISQIAGVVAQLVASLLPLVSTVLTALMPVFKALVPIVLAVLAAVLPLVSTLLSALVPVIQMLVPVVASLLEALMPIIDVVLRILEPILGLVGPLVELVGAVLPVLLSILDPLIERFGLIAGVLLGVVAIIAENLVPIIDSLSQVLGGLITFLTGVFTGDWEMAWQGIVDIFSGIWNTIVDVVQGTVNGIIGLINALIKGVNDIGADVGISIGLIPNVNFNGVKLADGALAKARPGGIIANIAEGRYDEAVLPLGGPQLEKIRAALQGGPAGTGTDAGRKFRDLILQGSDPWTLLAMLRHEVGGLDDL
jgi:tape measure domain-containing protein